MLFTSLEFILLFFPIVFGVYFLIPRKARNYWLLLASLFFYAWGEPSFVFVMLVSIGINYLLAIWISVLPEGKAGRKIVLAADVILNLGLLFVFKYLNFVISQIRGIFPGTQAVLEQTNIVLPIGISFFTFQAMSYVIDVFRGKAPVQRNPGYVGLYVSLFPQLIAGPIVRYTTVMDQIRERKVSFSDFSGGMIRFMTGFNKKILLANLMAEVADAAFTAKSNSVCMAWLGALCYALQIYYDFSGYSDMAIGLGRMLGFHFLENFDYPYISRTVTEFWRRWHISLGTWFRDYVYFPLGGSRVRTGRLVVNLLAVWFLTGIWHGANWTYLLWGMMYGVLIIAEKLTGLPKKLEKSPPAVRVLYRVFTLMMILFGWVLFRSADLAGATTYFKAMFGLGGNAFAGDDFIFNAREYIVFLLAGLAGAVPLARRVREKLEGRGTAGAAAAAAGDVLQLVLFVISISMLVMKAHNPFIYFDF